MIAWGQYPIASDPPPIAVADGAGEVIAVGPQVTRFKGGDHVKVQELPGDLISILKHRSISPDLNGA
jgi:NADPH:quinone reductase-like Zn-dependent oxidoreductase